MRGWMILPGLLVAGGLGWSAWWLSLAHAGEAAIAGWFADRAEAGWLAEHGRIEVGGFPMTLDRRVEDVRLVDPREGWALTAPLLVSTSPVIEPSRADLVLPPRFTFAVPGQRAEVRVGPNRAELALGLDDALPLDEATVTLRDARAEAPGWTAGIGTLDAIVARRPEAGPANAYAVRLEAADVLLPKPLLGGIDPVGALPAEVETVRLDAVAVLDHALDRDFVEAGELSARTLLFRDVELRWGDFRLDAEGRLDADADGFAEGRLTLAMTDWQRMLRLAEEGGAIGRSVRSAVEAALGFASVFSSRDGAVEIALDFGGGRIRIGPIAIGDAPRIAFPPRPRQASEG